MPIFNYICKKCELLEEKLVFVHDEPVDCVRCGKLMTKLVCSPRGKVKGYCYDNDERGERK